MSKLIFEKSSNRKGYSLPKNELNYELPIELMRDDELLLPEVSELDVVRHYTNLSRKNYGVEQGFYPLGSCTMKYNPKINEELANSDSSVNIHPLQRAEHSQGILQILFETNQMLSEITGMQDFSFSPFAGAHGELAGIMIMKEYFKKKKENRTKIIIPNAAHGTNPATASICGYEIITIKENAEGIVEASSVAEVLDDSVAGIMLTNPNTIGLFEKEIGKIADLMHENGSLLYYDGANLNAIMGITRPGDMGFDIIHLNLHKTFSTPHGGGGPGSGAVGVCKGLVDFLPSPVVGFDGLKYSLRHSDYQISGFYGNISVVIKAYYYLRTLGKENIANVALLAVLNANYIKSLLRDTYRLPIDAVCMHEVVFDGLINRDVRTLDIAKRLIDYGYHPPTIYFPLLFPQAMMIEPTECESKETLDEFARVLIAIANEDIEVLTNAPYTSPVRRLDEVRAARNPIVKYRDIV